MSQTSQYREAIERYVADFSIGAAPRGPVEVGPFRLSPVRDAGLEPHIRVVGPSPVGYGRRATHFVRLDDHDPDLTVQAILDWFSKALQAPQAPQKGSK